VSETRVYEENKQIRSLLEDRSYIVHHRGSTKQCAYAQMCAWGTVLMEVSGSNSSTVDERLTLCIVASGGLKNEKKMFWNACFNC